MSVKTIQKRATPEIHRLREIRDGKDKGLIFCEGERLIEELLSSSLTTQEIYCSKKHLPQAQRWLSNIPGDRIALTVLADDVMKFVSDLSAPPGVIAVAERPAESELVLTVGRQPLILVLHQIKTPNNVGALIRTAEAAGVTLVVTTKETADPFGPKALRGSSGSAFRMPILSKRVFLPLLDELKELKIQVLAAWQEGQHMYHQVDWTQSSALVLGSEATGFKKEELKKIETTLRLPMRGKLESLNVAAAGAICLYEAARQRQFQ